jgi:formate dehydrogenase subunit delta
MSGADTGQNRIYMANQIARFFVTQPGDNAPLMIADHMTAFWDPSMRRAIVEHLDQGGEGLDPAAREAVRILKTTTASGVERRMRRANASSVGHRRGDDAG